MADHLPGIANRSLSAASLYASPFTQEYYFPHIDELHYKNTEKENCTRTTLSFQASILKYRKSESYLVTLFRPMDFPIKFETLK